MSHSQQNTTKKLPFHTLIVDAWSETDESVEDVIWRFRVRDVRSGTQWTFASMDALVDHLHGHFGINPLFR